MKIYVLPDYRGDNPYQTLLMEALADKGVKYEFCKGYKRVFPIFRGLRADFIDADLVHLHWPDQYYKGCNPLSRFVFGCRVSIDLLLVRYVARKRLVWTLHNYGLHDDAYPILTRLFFILWCMFVYQVIIFNRCDIELVQKLYRVPEKKLIVLPHGHYQDAYEPLMDKKIARKQLNIDCTGRVFLFFGSWRPYKGLEDLLHVWPKHSKYHPEDLLIVAGSSHDRNYCDILRSGFEKLGRVKIVNRLIEETEVHRYYSAADVAILPFRRIANSGSLLLSLSFGLPCIAPDVPVVREVLGEAGKLTYQYGSVSLLQQKIAMASNTPLAELTECVKARRSMFAWNRIANKYLEYFMDDRHNHISDQ